MNKQMTFALALVMLSACGGSSNSVTPVEPAPDATPPALTADTPSVLTSFEATGSAVANADGTYIVIDGNDATNAIELLATNVFLNGNRAWQSTGTFATAFESSEVLAIGGVGNGIPFSGITGTEVPRSFTADFEGSYSIASASSAESGTMSLTYFSARGEISASSSFLWVDGVVDSNGQINGTVTYRKPGSPLEGETADFKGGFYGSDDLAGAFQNDKVAGAFLATEITLPD